MFQSLENLLRLRNKNYLDMKDKMEKLKGMIGYFMLYLIILIASILIIVYFLPLIIIVVLILYGISFIRKKKLK